MAYLLGAPRPLLEKLSIHLGLPVGRAQFGSFPDGERQVRIDENVCGETVVLLQSSGVPVDSSILELALLSDAARRAGAKRILAIVPYFGYSRSERLANSGSPLAARLIADLYTQAGISGLFTVDLHASAIVGFFNLPVFEISAMSVLAQHYRDSSRENYLVVSPDAGGIRRASKLANILGLPFGMALKERTNPSMPRILELWGNVENQHVILCDDIISTGGTLAEVAKLAHKQGAKSVEAIATHAVMAPGALQQLKDAGIQKLTISDSLDFQSPDVETISIAGIIADTVREMLVQH